MNMSNTRSLAIFSTLSVVLLSGCLAGASIKNELFMPPEFAESNNSYFPAEVGRAWVHKFSSMGGLMGGNVSSIVSGTIKGPDGKPMAVIASRSKQTLATSDSTVYYTTSDEQVDVYRVDAKVGAGVSGAKVNTRAAIIYSPSVPNGPQGHKAGDKWSVSYTQYHGVDPFSVDINKFGFWGNALANYLLKQGQGEQVYEKTTDMTREYEHLGIEKVKTAVGEFDAVKIKYYDHEQGVPVADSQAIQIDYYSKGIGLIKQVAYSKQTGDKPIFEMSLVSTNPEAADNLFYSKGLLGGSINDYKGYYQQIKNLTK